MGYLAVKGAQAESGPVQELPGKKFVPARPVADMRLPGSVGSVALIEAAKGRMVPLAGSGALSLVNQHAQWLARHSRYTGPRKMLAGTTSRREGSFRLPLVLPARLIALYSLHCRTGSEEAGEL
jgi:hypothetical protein